MVIKNEQLNHYTYEKLENHLSLLKKEYPFIKVNVIGTSVLNKNIYEIIIGKGNYHTHFNASFHGNEWITSSVLMKCINTFLLNISSNNEKFLSHFNDHTLSIVPMVNPDG